MFLLCALSLFVWSAVASEAAGGRDAGLRLFVGLVVSPVSCFEVGVCAH